MKTLSIVGPDDIFDQAVTALCANYGYHAQVTDPNNPGQMIANPVTAEDFGKAKLLQYIRDNIEVYIVKQASAAIEAARTQITQQLDAVAANIVATIN